MAVDWLMGNVFDLRRDLEFAVGDWCAIFSKEQLHMSPGAATIPSIAFMSAMILWKVDGAPSTDHISLGELIRKSVTTGGATLFIAIIVSLALSDSHHYIGFCFLVVGALVAGLGLSFLAPTIMNAET